MSEMNGKDFAQEAADRLNAARVGKGGEGGFWDASDYGEDYMVETFADTLAEQAQERAELAEIKADMADVHIKLSASYGLDRLHYDARELILEAHAIAAKHRAEVDPLVECLKQHWGIGTANWSDKLWQDIANSMRRDLKERGIELAQGGVK